MSKVISLALAAWPAPPMNTAAVSASSNLLDLAVVDSGKPTDRALPLRIGQTLTLGEGVTIGPYCVLRDVTVAAGTQIEAFSYFVDATIGAHARVVERTYDGRTVAIEGLIASYDGARVCRSSMTHADPRVAGGELAVELREMFGVVA